MTDTRPIGIFDSGVGGLLVTAAIHRLMPGEHLLFLGDSARLPYGGHGKEVVVQYAMQCCRHLLAHNVKAIVVACNTASAAALDSIVAELGDRVPVIGMIEGATDALLAAGGTRLGLLGTRRTISSGAYRRAIEKRSKARLIYVACPLWVPLVENDTTEGRIAEAVVNRDLRELKRFRPHAVLLACTHFPYLRAMVAKYLGPKTSIITGMETVAQRLSDTLKALDLEAEFFQKGTLRIMLTDDMCATSLMRFATDLPKPVSVTAGVCLTQ